MKYVLLTASVLLIAACSESSTEARSVESTNSQTTTTVTMDGETTLALTLSDGYIMAPLMGRDVAAGYFTATNSGDTAQSLVSAQSDVAANVELHTHTMNDGVMSMRKVDAVEVPAGGAVEFKPGSFHLMMFGFEREDGQTDAQVTLALASGETIELSLPIRDRE